MLTERIPYSVAFFEVENLCAFLTTYWTKIDNCLDDENFKFLLDFVMM